MSRSSKSRQRTLEDNAYSASVLKSLITEHRRENERKHKKKLLQTRKALEWDVDKIRKMIQEKIESHVKRPEDTVRHAYKLFGGRKGITKKVFRESLCRLGLDLPKSDLDTIFQKFDVDGSGVLDFQVDYERPTWTTLRQREIALQKQKKMIHPDAPYFPKSMEKHRWTTDQIEALVREKLMAHCKRPEDQFRKSFQMFGRPKHGITPSTLSKVLRRHGICLKHEELMDFFSRYDVDGSGGLDFGEFSSGVMEKDYPRKPWTMIRGETMEKASKARRWNVSIDVRQENAEETPHERRKDPFEGKVQGKDAAKHGKPF
eukprot:g1115.t1